MVGKLKPWLLMDGNMIEHIVLSGAGPNGLIQLGIVQEYIAQGYVDPTKLNKVYGCSAGAMIGALLAMHIPLDAVAEYMVKRPWNKFAKLEFLEMNERGGLIECCKIKEMADPLLLAYDIPLDITFRQAFEKSKIELHVFATNMTTFDSTDFNVHTFPDMSITTAVMLSSALPPVFTMGTYLGTSYVDGGFSDNFPLGALLNHESAPDPTTVLSVNLVGTHHGFKEKSTLLEICMHVALQTANKIAKHHYNHEIGTKRCPHYVPVVAEDIFSKGLWEKFLYSDVHREALYERGKTLGDEHLEKWRTTEPVLEA
jgi:predicted acylesterase/phospholipase RssA